MSPVQRFDHVGITVDDLEAVTAFFLALGLEREGSAIVEGDWVDTVVGLDEVRAEIVMLQAPDGGTRLEFSKFHTPVDERGPRAAPANEWAQTIRLTSSVASVRLATTSPATSMPPPIPDDAEMFCVSCRDPRCVWLVCRRLKFTDRRCDIL